MQETKAMISEKIKDPQIINYGIWMLYVVWNIILLIHHQLWRDEMNVWLMGRDLSPLQLIQELRFQGHPALWYYFIMLFAKLGFSCKIMGWLSLSIMAAAALLFVLKATFSHLLKLIVLASPIFTYYYSVHARNYCLIPITLIILGILYNTRQNKPILYGILLALLVQTDTIAVPIAGFLSMEWGIVSVYNALRRKESGIIMNCLKGIGFPLGSFFLFLYTMSGASDSTVFSVKDMGLYDSIQSCKGYAYVIMMRLTGLNGLGCSILFSLFLLVGVWFFLQKKPLLYIVWLGTYLFQIVFSVFVYELHIWHYLSLGLLFIWIIWIGLETKEKMANRKSLNYLIQIFTGVFCCLLLYRWVIDPTSGIQSTFEKNYSDAENTAEFIRDTIAEDEIVVESNVAYCSTIWGYLDGYKPYYAGSGMQVSYADWSLEQTQATDMNHLLQWVKDNFPNQENFYLIEGCNNAIDDWDEYKNKTNVELLYQTVSPSARHEDYLIYKIMVEEE